LRLNRELGADFDLDAFRHEARWDEQAGRIEMRLVSTRPQTVRVAGQEFRFAQDEPLVTEYSHKYALETFRALAESNGFRVARVWTDAERLFSVQLLVVD
jgi:uncharacterized SAM-dependent methyltransferase